MVMTDDEKGIEFLSDMRKEIQINSLFRFGNMILGIIFIQLYKKQGYMYHYVVVITSAILLSYMMTLIPFQL